MAQICPACQTANPVAATTCSNCGSVLFGPPTSAATQTRFTPAGNGATTDPVVAAPTAVPPASTGSGAAPAATPPAPPASHPPPGSGLPPGAARRPAPSSGAVAEAARRAAAQQRATVERAAALAAGKPDPRLAGARAASGGRTPARPAPRGLTRPISNALDKAGLERFSTGRYLAIWAGVVVVILATIGVLIWAGVSSARSVTPSIPPTPLAGAVLTGTVVTVETGKGAFKITLDADTPALKATIRNFRAKVASGFYDGKLFHRVLDSLAQGGDPTCSPTGGTACGNGGGTLNGEYVDTPFEVGAVGMASVTAHGLQVNDSQWFIAKQAAPSLTGNYPRFGKVTEGMDVVNKLVGCTYKDNQVDSCAGADKMLKVTLGSK